MNTETNEALKVTSQKSLTEMLRTYEMPLDLWGVGDAKTLEDLYNEINEGESQLVDENGELVRKTKVLAVDVYCHIEGKTYKLVEDRQEFVDGRVRRRTADVLDTSLGEKCGINESLATALARTMHEELGIEETTAAELDFETGDVVEKERPSGSYPGLKTRHVKHYYTTNLPPALYKEEGYREEQPGKKTTYFVWKETTD